MVSVYEKFATGSPAIYKVMISWSTFIGSKAKHKFFILLEKTKCVPAYYYVGLQ